MTPDDPRDPRPDDAGPLPVDELASALLDGALSDDEAAAARARPDVTARARAMEEARRALRDAPVPPHARRDRAVAAALAAFDDDRAGAAGSATAGEATAASRAGDRRATGDDRLRDPAPPAALHHRVPRAQRWLAAAAAAAVLAGLAGLAVATGDGRDDHDSAGSAADEATAGGDGGAVDDSGEGDAGGEAADRAEAEEAPMATADADLRDELAAADAGDLGSFPSADALVDHVAELVAEGGDEGRVPPADGDDGADTAFRQACVDDPAAPLADALATVLGGRAVVDGQPVDVWVVDTAEGRRVVALDDSCSPVVDRPIG